MIVYSKNNTHNHRQIRQPRALQPQSISSMLKQTHTTHIAQTWCNWPRIKNATNGYDVVHGPQNFTLINPPSFEPIQEFSPLRVCSHSLPMICATTQIQVHCTTRRLHQGSPKTHPGKPTGGPQERPPKSLAVAKIRPSPAFAGHGARHVAKGVVATRAFLVTLHAPLVYGCRH